MVEVIQHQYDDIDKNCFCNFSCINVMLTEENICKLKFEFPSRLKGMMEYAFCRETPCTYFF